MASGVQKVRRGAHPRHLLAPSFDPVGRRVNKGFKGFDERLEKKGFFPESTHLQAKEQERQQKSAIKKQRQQEVLREQEAESEISRRRLLRTTGGRRSLIASR